MLATPHSHSRHREIHIPIRLTVAIALALTGMLAASVGHAVTNTVAFIPMGSSWSYIYDGTDQGTAWQSPNFVDSAWQYGPAQFGFGEGDEATFLSYGPDWRNKYRTAYFRHSFEVADTNIFLSFSLSVLRDDGVVVYVNGTNVLQDNISSPFDYQTLADISISGGAEAIPVNQVLPQGVISNGTNVLAVEMHLYNRRNDWDMSFDLELTAQTTSAVSLAVFSTYGDTVPAVGTNIYLPETEIDCSVTESPLILNGATQVVCTGWIGTGSVTNGNGTNTTILITNDSTITWQWATNAFWLDTESSQGGGVVGGDLWVSSGSTAVLSAIASDYHHFAAWTGDTDGIDAGDPTIAVTMDRAKSLTAVFDVDTVDGALRTPFVEFALPSLVDRLTVTNQVPLTGPVSSNFTGCAAVPSLNMLLALASTPPSIQVYDMDGAYSGRTISLIGFSDPEGICVVDAEAGLFALVEEATNDISIVTISPATTNLSKGDAEVVPMGLNFPGGYDSGIEGISYSATNNGFFAVKEEQPMAVYWVPRQGGESPGASELFDAEAMLAASCSDLSDVAYDPYSGRLFLVCSETPRIVECDLEGNVAETFDLTTASPEGVSLSDDPFRTYLVTSDGTFQEYASDTPASVGDEGSQAQLEVHLSWPWTNTVSVDFEIVSDTAVAGSDYSPSNGTLTFVAGTTNTFITIDILGDLETEGAELLVVSLTNEVNSLLGRESMYQYTITGNTTVEYVVTSEYGGTIPDAGTNFVTAGIEVHFAVTNSPFYPPGGTTQYVCTGWTGTGSIPDGNGTETSVVILENSSITWLWETNVWLAVDSTEGGKVFGGNEWVLNGSSAKVDAVTFESRHFAGWIGDVPEAQTNERPLWLVMDVARSVQAVFEINTSSNGMLTYPVVSFKSSPQVDRLELMLSDTDLDGPVHDNISGCCLGPGTNEIMAISNRGNLSLEPPVIQVYDLDGNYKRSISMDGFDDTEGICQYDVDQDLYAIIEEGLAEITILAITQATTSLEKGDGETISMDVGAPLGNQGIEGIYYDATNKCFYAVKEYYDMKIYRVSLGTNSVTTEELFDAETVFDGPATEDDLSDIAYNPKSGLLYVLSDENKRIFECDLSGNILSSFPLTANQPEGITLSTDMSEIYVVGEPNEYFRYALGPQTDSGPEGTPFEMTVQLSWEWTNTVSVEYAITSSDPGVIPNADFEPVTGTVVFAASSTTQVVSISVPLDEDSEADEIIDIHLTNAVNSTLDQNRFYEYTILGNTAVSLIVHSIKGGCTPSPGTNIFNAGTIVPCRLTNSPIYTGTMATQYICVGWSGSNDIPVSGTDTNAGNILLTTNSSINWLWNTNMYLDVSWTGSGTVDQATGWYAAQSNILVTAQPTTYHHFVSWTGDLASEDTNDPQVTVAMDRPKSLSAEFAANIATNSTPEWWLARYHGHTNDFDAQALSDVDGDGMQAWEEHVADTIPNNATSRLALTYLYIDESDAVLKWISVTTRQYSVYSTLDLLTGWEPSPLASNLPGHVSGTNIFTDTNAIDGASYQIRTTRP